jgi:hypothetical protein
MGCCPVWRSCALSPARRRNPLTTNVDIATTMVHWFKPRPECEFAGGQKTGEVPKVCATPASFAVFYADWRALGKQRNLPGVRRWTGSEPGSRSGIRRMGSGLRDCSRRATGQGRDSCQGEQQAHAKLSDGGARPYVAGQREFHTATHCAGPLPNPRMQHDRPEGAGGALRWRR